MAREDIPLDQVGPNFGRGEEIGEKKERKKREENGGERTSTFSLYFPTIGSSVRVRGRGKVGPRIESYAWGTKIIDFCHASRDRGFSPTRFNSCLRVIQMVEVFRVGTAVHFSLKDLGLNVGIWGYFRIFRN